MFAKEKKKGARGKSRNTRAEEKLSTVEEEGEDLKSRLISVNPKTIKYVGRHVRVHVLEWPLYIYLR